MGPRNLARQAAAVAGVFVLSLAAWAEEPRRAATDQPDAKRQIYTCAMHPEIQWARPDKCPICDMKLVAKEDSAPSDERQMPNHARMHQNHEGMQHDHAGMGSMMMGCRCVKCMEMMGMGPAQINGMNHRKTAAPAARARAHSPRPVNRHHPGSFRSGRCGC
jgi:hypothetical protein